MDNETLNTLVLLKLKDVDLSGLSNQELCDKYNETKKEINDFYKSLPNAS